MSFDEQPDTLMHTDVLAKHDFAANYQPAPQPEVRLMMAVLADALFCFQKYHLALDRQAQKIFAEAQQWIFDDDGAECPFSFIGVCATLQISPSYLRRKLLHWKTSSQRPVWRSRAGMQLQRATSATIRARRSGRALKHISRGYPRRSLPSRL